MGSRGPKQPDSPSPSREYPRRRPEELRRPASHASVLRNGGSVRPSRGDARRATSSDRLPAAPSALGRGTARPPTRPGTPKDVSGRSQLLEMLHEPPPGLFPTWQSRQLPADRLPLRGIRCLARKETLHPRAARHLRAKACGCAPGDNALPIQADATFARYAPPKPLARTRRTAQRSSLTPSCCNPGYQQSLLHSHSRRGFLACPRRSTRSETKHRPPRCSLRRGGETPWTMWRGKLTG